MRNVKSIQVDEMSCVIVVIMNNWNIKTGRESHITKTQNEQKINPENSKPKMEATETQQHKGHK